MIGTLKYGFSAIPQILPKMGRYRFNGVSRVSQVMRHPSIGNDAYSRLPSLTHMQLITQLLTYYLLTVT